MGDGARGVVVDEMVRVVVNIRRRMGGNERRAEGEYEVMKGGRSVRAVSMRSVHDQMKGMVIRWVKAP